MIAFVSQFSMLEVLLRIDSCCLSNFQGEWLKIFIQKPLSSPHPPKHDRQSPTERLRVAGLLLLRGR